MAFDHPRPYSENMSQIFPEIHDQRFPFRIEEQFLALTPHSLFGATTKMCQFCQENLSNFARMGFSHCSLVACGCKRMFIRFATILGSEKLVCVARRKKGVGFQFPNEWLRIEGLVPLSNTASTTGVLPCSLLLGCWQLWSRPLCL